MKATSLVALGPLVSALLAGAGCGRTHEPAKLTSAPAGDETVTKARMRDHDVHGAKLRDAVARADLDAAHREARALAELRPEGDLVPTWRDRLDAMNAAAARVAGARDVAGASNGLAALARTCGDCHATLGGPVDTTGEPPPEGADVALRMKRHDWAATRLWEGLVVPSDRAWRAGARVLQDAPLKPETLTPGKTPVIAVDALAESVHALGRKASVVASPTDRGAVYGELMATCGSCHELLAGGPR